MGDESLATQTDGYELVLDGIWAKTKLAMGRSIVEMYHHREELVILLDLIDRLFTNVKVFHNCTAREGVFNIQPQPQPVAADTAILSDC